MTAQHFGQKITKNVSNFPASTQASTSKWQIYATSPLNTNLSVVENGFSTKKVCSTSREPSTQEHQPYLIASSLMASVKFQPVLFSVLRDGQRTGAIDRTQGTPGSIKRNVEVITFFETTEICTKIPPNACIRGVTPEMQIVQRTKQLSKGLVSFSTRLYIRREADSILMFHHGEVFLSGLRQLFPSVLSFSTYSCL